jgi:osmotically-inducible protein OsmY
MATSAPHLQPSVASSSQTSSTDKKTSAEWKKYFEVLLERKKAAGKGKGKGKPADWWQYLTVILQTDPSDPEKAWNVALQCQFCEAFLSSSNPSRMASTHLMKGGCPKVRGDADIATEVSAALQRDPICILLL